MSAHFPIIKNNIRKAIKFQMFQSDSQTAINHQASAVSNADEAASIVLSQAMQAVAQGTFAVGGAIVENATGRVIHKMHNNVLKKLATTSKAFTYDPTAHGELQLVYWYYEHKTKLNLPEPEQLTIVTTLDPCAMCTGTLLTAGFNVGVIAMDDFAGINCYENFTFGTLPQGLRNLAKSKFGYYACGEQYFEQKQYVTDYVGGSNVALRETIVSRQKLMDCRSIFEASVNQVRQDSYDAGLAPDKLSDPATLSEDSPIKIKYREIYPDAFQVKISQPRFPKTELFNILKQVTESEQDAKNSVALLDPFGNLILCLPDTFHISPVHTAFMNVTRHYATIRFELMDDQATQPEAKKYLTHPKYGTFVFLYAPNPNDTTTIMTLGAYGSTLEGPVPQIFPANFQYYCPPFEGTVEELRSVIMNLPKFYTEIVQISVMEVANVW